MTDQSGEQIDVLVDSTTYTMTDSLEFGRSYVWKVRGATEEIAGAWSELQQFTTEAAEDTGDGDDTITELAAPVLVAPDDSSENISTQPHLSGPP